MNFKPIRTITQPDRKQSKGVSEGILIVEQQRIYFYFLYFCLDVKMKTSSIQTQSRRALNERVTQMRICSARLLRRTVLHELLFLVSCHQLYNYVWHMQNSHSESNCLKL